MTATAWTKEIEKLLRDFEGLSARAGKLVEAGVPPADADEAALRKAWRLLTRSDTPPGNNSSTYALDGLTRRLEQQGRGMALPFAATLRHLSGRLQVLASSKPLISTADFGPDGIVLFSSPAELSRLNLETAVADTWVFGFADSLQDHPLRQALPDRERLYWLGEDMQGFEGIYPQDTRRFGYFLGGVVLDCHNKAAAPDMVVLNDAIRLTVAVAQAKNQRRGEAIRNWQRQQAERARADKDAAMKVRASVLGLDGAVAQLAEMEIKLAEAQKRIAQLEGKDAGGTR